MIKRINVDLQNVERISGGLALCLGYFDGLHVGHLALITEAKKTGQPVGIITFANSNDLLATRRNRQLTSIDDRLHLLDEMGVDYLFVIDFTLEIRDMEADDFVKNVIIALGATYVICGEDFHFGRGAQGGISNLRDDFKSAFKTLVVKPILDAEGNKISSSLIKKYLDTGEIEKANQLLGREYIIYGKVKHGFGNGKGFGFPTANLDLLANYVVPKNGVYAVRVLYQGQLYWGAANIGTHPTIMETTDSQIEVFILDFHSVVYTQNIGLYFVRRLRDEVKFASISELKRAMAEDVEKVRALSISVSLEK
ncbi:MAG TPA: bifunctional riboflavin kinase/FAD synthetase [Bacilli bacterium]|nr:bifunctional riboflavin kinase/FAD synthetase [Bacilli bacterium]